MPIPNETLDEIRAAVDAVAVMGQHTDLKQSGTRWKGLCPFHDERTQLAAYLWRRICTILDATPIDIIDKTPRKGIFGNYVNIVNVGCVSKRKVWRASQGKLGAGRSWRCGALMRN